MFLISIIFSGIGLLVGFFAGKHLLTPLFLSLAHLIDDALGFAVSRFFRKFFLSANEPEFILDGDPLKLPVMIIGIGISMWIGWGIFSKIGDFIVECIKDDDGEITE